MGEKFAGLSDYEKSICSRFKLAREDAGVTQERLGLHIGLSRDQVASVELERVALRFWPGWKFCLELDINAAWLAYGEEPIRPCVDYFKTYMAPPGIENNPNITFGAGFPEIGLRYEELFKEVGYIKPSGGGLRKELKRGVHRGAARHKRAINLLIDTWLNDVGPENREIFVAHLCKSAQDFKNSLKKKR